MKSTRIKTTAIISLLLAVTMLGGSLVWGGGFTHTTNGPYGGVIQAMVVAGDGALYAGVYKGWTFKSVDGGDNWAQSVSGIPNTARDIRALVASSDAVYAGSFSGGVFKKLNTSSTWSQMNTNLDNLSILSLLVDPCTPGILYAGTNGSGVYRWTDPGPWEPINSGALSAIVLTLAMTSDCTLYLGQQDDGTNYGVYYWNGTNWQPRNAGLPANTTVRSLLPDGNNLWAGTGGQGVYYWNGSTWSARNTGLPAGGAQSVSVVGRDGNGQVYAGTEDGFYHWTTTGSQWELRDTGLEGNGRHVNVFVSTGGGTLFAGSDGRGVFGSTNGGLAWTEKNHGLSGHIVRAVAINPQYDWRIFAGTYRGGIYWSVNGGQSWNWWSEGLGDVEVETLAVTYPAGAPIYTGLNGQGVYRRDKVDYVHWTDWLPKNDGLTGSALIVHAMAIAPDDPDIVFAGTDGGVYKSTNAGDAWSVSSTGLPYAVTALAIDPVNPLTMCAGTKQYGVYRSTDRGQSWSLLSGLSGNAARILSLAIDSNQNIMAGTRNGVYKYTGAWQEDGLQGTEIDALVVNPITQTIVYAGSAEGLSPAGIWESTQDGWVELNNGLGNYNVHALTVDDYRPQTLHAGTGGSSVWDYTFALALPQMIPEMGVDVDDGVTLVHLGDLLTYTVAYYNDGSVEASGVVVSMTLPNNTEYVSSYPPFEQQVAQPNVYWLEVDSVALETAYEAQFTVRILIDPPYPTTITANAKIWDDGGSGEDPFLANNKDSDIDDVELGDLTISFSKEAQPASGTTVSPGSLITYTIRYENEGFLPCSSGVLTDTFDPSGSYTVVSTIPAPDEGDNIWHPATLGPSKSGEIQIVVQLADALPNNWPVTNQASLDCAEGEPYESDIVQHTVVNPPDVHLPDLTIGDIQWQPAEPETNTLTSFNVTVRNEGVVDLDGYFWVELYLKPSPSDPPAYPSDHDQGYCLNGCNDLRADYVQLVSGLLPAGASFSVPFSGAQLFFPTSGYYDIYAQADVAFSSAEFNPYWGHIAEEREDNNIRHEIVLVRGGGNRGMAGISAHYLQKILIQAQIPPAGLASSWRDLRESPSA